MTGRKWPVHNIYQVADVDQLIEMMNKIRLLQGVASRATAFHEWLHRCRRLRGIDLDSQAADEALIEDFLRRHSVVLGLSEGE